MIAECATNAELYSDAIVSVGTLILIGFVLWLFFR